MWGILKGQNENKLRWPTGKETELRGQEETRSSKISKLCQCSWDFTQKKWKTIKLYQAGL